MEPISLIVAAMAAGAGAAAKETVGQAVEDAYGAFKAMLRRVLRGNPEAAETLEEYAGAVESGSGTCADGTLRDALARSGAADDPDVVAAAKQVLEQVGPPGEARSKYVLNSDIVNGQSVGDHSTVTMNFGTPRATAP